MNNMIIMDHNQKKKKKLTRKPKSRKTTGKGREFTIINSMELQRISLDQ